MSVDYTGYAIIGVRIDGNALYHNKLVRNCECDVSCGENSPNFCPECGMEFQSHKDILISEVKEVDYDDITCSQYQLLGKYSIVFHNSYHYDYNNKGDAYVALRITQNSDDDDKNQICLPAENDIEKFKKDLSSLRLWNDKFGIWAVCKCN